MINIHLPSNNLLLFDDVLFSCYMTCLYKFSFSLVITNYLHFLVKKVNPLSFTQKINALNLADGSSYQKGCVRIHL